MKVSIGYHEALNSELNTLHILCEEFGVDVVRLKSPRPQDCIHGDFFSWTPAGLIMSTEVAAIKWFDTMCIEPEFVIEPPGTFSGADLLWLPNRSALLGTGTHTNWLGLCQVADWLKSHRYTVRMVHLPPNKRLLDLVGVLNQTVVTSTKYANLFKTLSPAITTNPLSWFDTGKCLLISSPMLPLAIISECSLLLSIHTPKLLKYCSGLSRVIAAYSRSFIGAPNGKAHPRLVC